MAANKPIFNPNLYQDFDPTYTKAARDFLNAKALKRPKTRIWYEQSLRYFGNFLHAADLPQWPPDPDNVNAFLADCAHRDQSESTISAWFRAIRAWLNWLHKRGRIDNIVPLIEKPPQPFLLPKVVEPDVIIQLLGHLESLKDWRGVRDYALITLALDAGARISELSALKLNQVDLETGTIHLTQTKTGRDRIVVFSKDAASRLANWLEVRSGLSIPASLDNLFVGKPRSKFGPFTDWGIRQTLQARLKQAGLDHFNFHRLRHSYAVYTLRAKGDLLDIQKQLGHRSIATTSRYLLVDDTGRQSRHQDCNPLAYLGGSND